MQTRAHENESPQQEIERIRGEDIPYLLERLPYGSVTRHEFSALGKLWRFDFSCRFKRGNISTSAVGESPTAAFIGAKERLLEQIRAWHETRFTELGMYLRNDFVAPRDPKILLIDDDEDQVLAMDTAFSKLGWQTDVAIRHEGLHHKIATSDVDYILLDWNLNNAVTADRVFTKAIRLIDTFSDLREKFKRNKPRIVTFSVLDRQQVELPLEVREFFEHVDHWQKPLPFGEVLARVTSLKTATQEGS